MKTVVAWVCFAAVLASTGNAFAVAVAPQPNACSIRPAYDPAQPVPSNAPALPLQILASGNAKVGAAASVQNGIPGVVGLPGGPDAPVDRTLQLRADDKVRSDFSYYLLSDFLASPALSTQIDVRADCTGSPNPTALSSFTPTFGASTPLPTTIGALTSLSANLAEVALSEESLAYWPLTQVEVVAPGGETLFTTNGYGNAMLVQPALNSLRIAGPTSSPYVADGQITLSGYAVDPAQVCGNQKSGTVPFKARLKTHIAGAATDPAPLELALSFDCSIARLSDGAAMSTCSAAPATGAASTGVFAGCAAMLLGLIARRRRSNP